MKMPYRVGLDARPLSTPVSGVGRLIAELLVAFPDKENYKFILYTNKPIHPTHASILEIPNIEVFYSFGFLSKKGGLFFNVVLPFQIYKSNLDLFWGSQQVLPPFLPEHLPAVLTYCDLVLYLFPQTMRTIARIQQKFFQKYSVNRSGYILSISEQTKNDVVKQFGYNQQKTGVTYPGVDTEHIQKQLGMVPSEAVQKIDYPFLLSVSTIEPRKNYPFLLEVYRRYRERTAGKNLKWVIVGKFGWSSELFYTDLQKDILQYRDILHITDATDTDLHHLYSKCKLFLMASIYEGFGIPLLEALAHKKPCIVSDIPVFHEIGEDKISYLPLTSSESWVSKIIELQDRDDSVNIDIHKFSWKRSATIMKQVFDQFLVSS
jgi:glycosyltransferase involved in cell wall biosynthesis